MPCIMSAWTNWQAPDATGTIYRYRAVVRPPLNGGNKCEELFELKKGNF